MIIIVVCIALFIWLIRKCEPVAVANVAGTVFGIVVGFCIATMLPMNVYEKEYIVNIEPIQNKYYVGTSHTNDGPVYLLFTEDKGPLEASCVSACQTEIKYTNGAPIVRVFYKKPTNSLINYFAFDLDVYTTRFVIEVPPGSIAKEFMLNIK